MSKELIDALTVLVPGFLAAAVYYSLTSRPKPKMFERVVQALMFTVIVLAIAAPLAAKFEFDLSLRIGGRSSENDFGAAVLLGVAVLVGGIAAIVANTDAIHWVCRWLRITNESSHPTEWYSSFYSRNDNEFVVLHLANGRRLYGWPAEWPNSPDKGHFRIEDGQWLDQDNKPLVGRQVHFDPCTRCRNGRIRSRATQESVRW